MNRRKHRKRRTTRKQRPRRRITQKRAAPRTAEEFFAKSKQFQDRWARATHVISKMRADRVSLNRASREFGIAPRMVRRLAGKALRKRANGRYAAKASDRLLRVLVIPTPDGLRDITTRDSREASQLAEYWIAVHRYLQTGDASSIKKF